MFILYYSIVVFTIILHLVIFLFNIIYILDMHPLAAASRSRLLETEPKLFVFETSYYALICGRYCFEYVAS